MSLPESHPLRDGRTSTSALVRAYSGERPATPPIWFMRQAGRSLPEYKQVRAGVGMLESCLMPELTCEITLQPVRRHGVDAAIFFSDIVVPAKIAGVGVDIKPGVGPVVEQPIRTLADVEALPRLTLDDLAPISQAVRLITDELGTTPLIGFAGAPFTVASYLIEGKPSKEHLITRALMHSAPEVWNALLAWTAETSGLFLRAQALAGASVVQLFDSWAGGLSRRDYETFVAPHSAATLAHVSDLGIRRSHFGVNTGELLGAMHAVGADVVGVDHRISLAEASRRLGSNVPVQGNIDPALLRAPWEVLERHVLEVLDSGLAAPAHIVNLGHGVPPDTDPTVLTRIVELVHART
ncbi:uroporphyrinogen decarboxylase [Micrococcales bacterium 31B]|nr:uroporphyrinogen decarboxylase [Micrococcales bacterium 31B]